jgi:hypothetical protein
MACAMHVSNLCGELFGAKYKSVIRPAILNIEFITVRGNFGFLWSCSHSFYVKALHDYQGVG